LDFDRATFSSRLPLLSVLTCSFLLSLYIFKCAIDHAQTLENMPLPRAQTFDPGTRTKTTTEGNAVRARFQGIVKSVTVEKKNTYRHEPIDYDNEIRILKILHGEGNDKLECMLFPSKLRKDKDRNGDGNGKGAERTDRYWALSYSWGDMNEVASNKITIYHE
jgi:hypothetical protein